MFTKNLLRSSSHGGATSPTNSTSSSLTSTTSSNNNKNSSKFSSSKLERFLKGRASNTKHIQEKSKKITSNYTKESQVTILESQVRQRNQGQGGVFSAGVGGETSTTP